MIPGRSLEPRGIAAADVSSTEPFVAALFRDGENAVHLSVAQS